MHLASLLERARELHPDQPAVVEGDLRLTYRQFSRRVASLAGWMHASGVRAGERVALLDHNSTPFLEAYFAAAQLGAVLAPLNTRLSHKELAFIVEDCGAELLLAGPECAPAVAALLGTNPSIRRVLWLGVPPAGAGGSAYAEALACEPRSERAPLDPDSLAHLYYTSGTTGRPKGVMLSHRNVWVHALSTVAELGLSDRDRWGHIAPLFHLADAWATFAITWVGGVHVVVPRFEEEAVFGAIERERITITNLVPTMLTRLVRHPGADARDVRSLRRILSGGAPIAPEVVREIMRVFRCEYVQTYGMTETSPYLTLSLLKAHLSQLPPDEQFRYRAKTGRPFAAVELDVVGEDGRSVPRDGASVGEIRARGATVTSGYWKRPDETRAAFDNGWLKTGDLATVDAEGYLQIVDRKKDMIITGGEKVYSTEVENVLYEHAAVLEAAVYGLPDDVWGERVCAAVALRVGATASEPELIAFCRERLTHYKAPRTVRFVPELPKTGSGKIQKSVLRSS
ncbi:MAG: long-chain-fatty-acid--CoA ligase [Planctomycetes bacterium]|nr:long-chain-fatty-acid--CoA ligase [Planctomycetota bacterium]